MKARPAGSQNQGSRRWEELRQEFVAQKRSYEAGKKGSVAMQTP
jgi:hypothetical protein